MSVSSRCDGYSWSWPLNEPDATPAKSSSSCTWQLPGSSGAQWWRSSDQLSALAGSVPCCASVAEPEKEICWPGRHCRLAAGEAIVACGAVLASVLIVIGSLTSEAPRLSVTRRRTSVLPSAV